MNEEPHFVPMTMDPSDPTRIHPGRIEQRIATLTKEQRQYVKGSFSWNVKTEGIMLLKELLSYRAALTQEPRT